MALALTQAIVASKYSLCALCCRSTPKIRLCGGCLSVYYCSRKCQFLHWTSHKPECISSRVPDSFVPRGSPVGLAQHQRAALHGPLWTIVASYLENVVDVLHLRAVSRTMKVAVRAAAVTLNFDAYRSWNATKQATVAIQFPNTRSLLLHNIFRDFSDRHIAAIVSECKNLQSFAITQLYCADRVDVVQTWPQLSAACMAALAYHCPRLRSVYVPVSIDAAAAGLNAVALGCRSLRAMTVCLTGAMQAELLCAARKLPHLRALDLRKAPVSAVVVRRAGRCRSLRALRIVFHPVKGAVPAEEEAGMDAALAALLASHPRMRTLALSGLQDPQSLQALCGPAALTRLDLNGSDAATDAVVAAAVRACPGLRSVDLSRTRAGDAALTALATLRWLVAVQVRGAGRVTSAGVAALAAARGRQLQVLEMGGNGARPDAAWLRALMSCGALRQLAVIDCVADCDTVETVLLRMPALEVLHMTRAPGAPQGLTDKAARRLLSLCTGLRVLSLPWHSITTRTVQAAARQLPNLAAIDLCRTDVGDVAMAALSACRQLQAVRVANTSVTDAGIEALVGACRGLRFVETFGSRVSQAAAGRLTTRGISVLHEQTLDDRAFSVADFVVPLPYITLAGPVWAAAPPWPAGVAVEMEADDDDGDDDDDQM